ncbi:unnamed protein product [Leptidea sinapis]|uniref:Insulin-like domain-containing protein n=1 Tax=Leptidea sinapis TaxID=189913 RepID=A0A5E4QDS5_9NEOP|nr:unnamed protein product [Leptidea sinapis]
MKLAVLVFFVVAVMVSKVAPERNVYCGRRLAMAIALLCENSPSVKRSDSMLTFAELPWIAMNTARTLGRGKRQIVTECCMKACTEDEIMSYC